MLIGDSDFFFFFFVFCIWCLYMCLSEKVKMEQERRDKMNINEVLQNLWRLFTFPLCFWWYDLEEVNSVFPGFHIVLLILAPSMCNKAGKGFGYTSDAGTSQICQFKMPGKRPVGSASPCTHQNLLYAHHSEKSQVKSPWSLPFHRLNHLKCTTWNERISGKCAASVYGCVNVDYYF